MVRDPSIVSPSLTGVFIGGGHNKHGTGSRCTLPKQCRPPSPRRRWRCDRSSYKRSLFSRIRDSQMHYLTGPEITVRQHPVLPPSPTSSYATSPPVFGFLCLRFGFWIFYDSLFIYLQWRSKRETKKVGHRGAAAAKRFSPGRGRSPLGGKHFTTKLPLIKLELFNTLTLGLTVALTRSRRVPGWGLGVSPG